MKPESPKEIFSADGRIIWHRSAGMITFAVGIAGRLYRCSRRAEHSGLFVKREGRKVRATQSAALPNGKILAREWQA